MRTIAASVAGLALILACQPPELPPVGPYPVHHSITTTEFWIGETASVANCFRGNQESAWDDRWQEHYGGYDDPDHRSGWLPAGLVPKENPFYVALPYNDFTGGHRRASASQVIYWAGEKTWSDTESMCKNRWLRMVRSSLTVYAQWEDVGPFLVNDSLYVFGERLPRNPENDSAGLDVSPAVHDYLGLTGLDKIDWQFVPFDSVPDGPWKSIITFRQVCWERAIRDCGEAPGTIENSWDSPWFRGTKPGQSRVFAKPSTGPCARGAEPARQAQVPGRLR